MLYPSIDTLMTHINSKYTLCTISARRARELLEIEEAVPMIDNIKSAKYVGVALEEIERGKLDYTASDDPSKQQQDK
ncbi:DNA-directed RNA polymerase subunit omega [Sinobaca sp. H24]|uniref:DNA-directed RNA polymerase subunit omega n=1 Tax=Sinobaca sp. H24 TaxID=2923376 RepID=UPI0020799038|nr:DNA-directed RNA polymerase subunit omega [Sinobaca sp. H24]